jgi:ABC-type transport system substrate-binding protein
MAMHPRHYFGVFALLLLAHAAGAANAADVHKVLRIASNDITSLDPQQGTDLYSTRVASAIFEALYEFEYLSTGSKVVPNTAEALPIVTDDGKIWTVRMKKGVRFAEDPVFKGKPRELVAADYAYSIRRSIDPNLRGGGDPSQRASPARNSITTRPSRVCRRPIDIRSSSGSRVPITRCSSASRASPRWPSRARSSKRQAPTSCVTRWARDRIG